MTTDFRALCAELADALGNAIRVIHREDGTLHISTAEPVLERARAALAEPQPEPPTDGEVAELVAWLRESASYHDAVGDEEAAAEKCRRIADLLERKQPETPTHEELDELFTEIDQSGESESWRAYAL